LRLIQATRNDCRMSGSRCRAASQLAAKCRGSLPRAALADSLALGYYRPPLQGFQFAALQRGYEEFISSSLKQACDIFGFVSVWNYRIQ
jgi:hypothetical protein